MPLQPLRVGRQVAKHGGAVARGFARFLLRGRTADLAVAVVVGAAIGTLINSFVSNILTPLVSALLGSTTPFEGRTFLIGAEPIKYGNFLNSLIAFLLVAGCVYFFIMVPTNKVISNSFFQPPPDPALRKCPECQSDIPKTARRCMFCTQPVPPESV